MKIQDFVGKKIAILGFGKEGKSTLEFLIKNGIDAKQITILDGNKDLVIDFDVNKILGNTYLDGLADFDIIIKTPGISLYDKKINPYKNKITSQMQIFFDNYKGKTICISGTKGKSTTTTLAYETLKTAGKNVKLVGNIGNPVLDEIDFSENYDYVIMELSSYMLEGLQKTNYISILVNIYEDHLDWHNGFENYKNAKLNLLNGANHCLIFNPTIEKFNLKENNVISFGDGGKYYFKNGGFFVNNQLLFDNSNIKLLGEHNMSNISAIIGMCDIIGIDYKYLKETLKNFNGLKHRIEFVGKYHGIEFYDDAISTTPESTIQAIKTFGNKIDTIFLGGTDRGYHFEGLIKELNKYGIKKIVLFPPSGERIKDLLDSSFDYIQTSSMQEAVNFAFQKTLPNKICLLSCASPSYSIWKNFEEKGDLFQKYVKGIFSLKKDWSI